MKIAITADAHLTHVTDHPERFHALENILTQLAEQGISRLVIAGDLFDQACDDPAEFEALVGRKDFQSITLHILPGNHDAARSKGAFTLPNIRYHVAPELAALSEVVSLFFVPYRAGTSVGEVLAAHQDAHLLVSP